MRVPNIPDLDLATPSGRDDAGRPFWSVRCRVPMALDATFRDVEVREARAVEVTVGSDDPDKAPNIAVAAAQKAGPTIDGPVIEGIASSTGVDSYGTEMSATALEDMAGQFRGKGVVYLPTHPGFFSGGGEWDDVMGYVHDAEILRGDVPSKADEVEPGFLLRVRVQLDSEHPKTAPLAKRLQAGHAIGQSIGGWFTRLRFVYPDGTDPEEAMAGWVMPDRVIVEGVELDHLAATRSPANRESYIEGVRSALRDQSVRTRERGEAVRAARASVTPAVPAPTLVAEVARTEEPVAEPALVAPATRDAMDAPSYRPQSGGSAERCDRCVHYKADASQESAAGQCDKFKFLTRGEYTCDDWAEDPEKPSATAEDLTAAGEAATNSATSQDEDRSKSGLDTDAAAAHDGNVNTQVGQDAPRGAPADTATTPSTEERSMPDTAPNLDQRLDALTRAVEALVAKQTPATDAAPAKPAETPEQRRIRELEAQLSTVLSEPQRRGIVVGHLPAHEVATGIDALVGETDTQGRAKALVAVTRSARVHRTLTEADGPGKVGKADIEQSLRAVILAGVSDGVIAEPNEFVSWDRR